MATKPIPIFTEAKMAERLEEVSARLAAMERNETQDLNPVGRGGTSEVMDRAQIEDIVAASEARGDTKLERALGELRADIRALDTKLSGLPGRWEIVVFLVGTILAVVGLMIAILSYGGDRLSTGAEISKVAKEAATEAVSLQAKH